MSSTKYIKSAPKHVGDVRKGRFAVLAESSSEDEAEIAPLKSLQQLIAANPILSAMFDPPDPTVRWGDLDLQTPAQRAAEAAALAEWEVEKAAASLASQVALEGLWAQEGGIWDQPFSRNLEMHGGDAYDFSDLTDAEYEACMTWLYANGWHVALANRQGASAFPDDLPPRVWMSDRFAALLEEAPVAEMPVATIRVQKPKSKVTVPRFCRASAGGVPCAEAACRYVHADTMPRLNKPCGFGALCGGTDPAKRASCIYMHPGETWTAELVVTRPAN